MFLKSLAIKNFKKFNNQTVNFNGDLTVIKGNNEDGKSTLAEAIITGLFMNPESQTAKVAIGELKSWGQEKLFKITMTFEDEGREFVLEKDFENKKQTLTETASEDTEGKQKIEQFLRNFLFFNKSEVFKKFAVISGRDIMIETAEKKDIKKLFQDIISGSESSPDEIMKKIKDKADSLGKGLDGRSQKAGSIKESEEKIKELLHQKNEKESHLIKSREYAKDLSKKEQEKAEAAGLISDYADILEEFKKYNQLNEEIKTEEKNLGTKKEKTDFINKKIEEKRSIEAKLERFSPLKRVNLQNLKNTYNESLKKLTEKNIYEKELAEKQEALKKNKEMPAAGFYVVAGILFLVGLGGLFYWWFYFSWALLAVFAGYKFLKTDSLKKESLNELKKRLEAINETLAEKEKILGPIADELGIEPDQFQATLTEYETSLKDLEKQGKDMDLLLKNSNIAALTDEQEKIISDIERKKILLKDIGAKIKPYEKSILKTEKDLKMLQKKEKELSEEIIKLRTLLSQKGANDEDIAKIDEQISYHQERSEKDKLMLESLEVLKELLKESQNLSQQKTRDRFKELIERYVFEITSGKYSRIKLDDDLTLWVFSEEKRDWILPEDHLSTGAIDQVYFVARIAFLTILSEGKRTILLLDDPFLNFDKERKAKTKQILEDLTRNFQIILLTCSEDYNKWGNVVSL
jgi:uncharacterized protein YhaN